MAKEAADAEERCLAVAGTFEGKKKAIVEKAREVNGKARDMMSTYLDRDAEALDEVLEGSQSLAAAEDPNETS